MTAAKAKQAKNNGNKAVDNMTLFQNEIKATCDKFNIDIVASTQSVSCSDGSTIVKPQLLYARRATVQ